MHHLGPLLETAVIGLDASPTTAQCRLGLTTPALSPAPTMRRSPARSRTAGVGWPPDRSTCPGRVHGLPQRLSFLSKAVIHVSLFLHSSEHEAASTAALDEAAQLGRVRHLANLVRCALIENTLHAVPQLSADERRGLHLNMTRSKSKSPMQSYAGSGPDASASAEASTRCFASIHFGASSRSSSGRFIVKAATRTPPLSHHTLKLPDGTSPR